MDSKPTAAVITLGCKVNQYESEAIAEGLEKHGFKIVPDDAAADIYIINTCTVTSEADHKSRKAIRHTQRLAPGSSVIVLGCSSEGNPELILQLDGVRYVLGNRDKLRSVELACDIIKNGPPPRPVCLIPPEPMKSVSAIAPMSITHAPRTRAYVKICDGCDGKCTYCIIRHVRGDVRSRLISDIIPEVRGLVDGGCREVVLTGIETASFGHDTGEDLTSLLRELSSINGLERIRMGSLEPTVMRDDFIKALSSLPHIVPHFHLSIQSGCSRTLAAMKRKYNAQQAMEKLMALRDAIPDVMFTTDIIVGFPGETEEDFAETLEFARKARFLHMHVFPFSRRKGTPADAMDGQLPESVKRDRSSRLIAEGERIAHDVISEYVARVMSAPVLFEADEGMMHSGHTENFVEVRVPLCGITPGEIRLVHFDSVSDDNTVLGHLV